MKHMLYGAGKAPRLIVAPGQNRIGAYHDPEI
jgi:hypothetical protein